MVLLSFVGSVVWPIVLSFAVLLLRYLALFVVVVFVVGSVVQPSCCWSLCWPGLGLCALLGRVLVGLGLLSLALV